MLRNGWKYIGVGLLLQLTVIALFGYMI
jgi:hypothetical protein